ncbi:MAG: hypothetical protein WC755_09005 [Candidatus Woesearchaeota archaeon]|jgi:hypothetical protein
MANSLPLFERLKQKSSYKSFIDENEGSFLYALFCILSNKEKEGDKIQFDFYIPSYKKVAYSEYPFDAIKVQNQGVTFEGKKLDLGLINVDVEDLWEVVEKIQLEKNDKEIITKIIGVLRESGWDLTCTTQSLNMLRIKLDAVTKECTSYKKENLSNLISIRKK